MAGVKLNFDAIQKAADAAIKTDEAKSEAKKAFRNYINGSASGERLVGEGSGKAIPTKAEMRTIANDFVKILTNEAGEVPGSIAAILQSTMMIGPIEQSDNIFVYEIVIPRDLHRESLWPEQYDGVDNIIALFDEGYTASNYVYGQKYGPREYTSDEIVHGRKRMAGRENRIRSRISREPLNFMNNAAEAFNSKYSSIYNVELKVGWR